MSHNDFILPISFRAAQEIGLEESVLLAFLAQHAFLLSSKSLSFDIESLSAQLPFWTSPVLLRILSSLQLCQSLQFERAGNRLTIHLQSNLQSKETVDSRCDEVQEPRQPTASPLLDKVSRLKQQAKKPPSFGETLGEHHVSAKKLMSDERVIEDITPIPQDRAVVSSSSWSGVPGNTNENRRGVTDFDLYLEQKERTRQPDKWQPEEATLEQITQAGIHRKFALQLQAEFLLRIKEQRKNVRTWNSEFFKYVKRQWQYQQSDRSSYEGTQGSSYNPRTSKEQVSDALSNIHDTDW